ncbi:MAG: hypothetical protein CMM44_08695 [Rhodospirillaceae bacterium]|nr:hypothetical protein [Rhodospirillaceae bacterium]|tara:strand:+ start:4532 stop:4957 length:426 start_codon:yes stop_codon:yes gene_type:complete
MISFDLKCENDHKFESWFQSGDAFDRLVKAKQVICPICGNNKITKALMAPAVSRTKKNNNKNSSIATNALDYMNAMRTIRRQVEENSDYVGSQFAEEARKIHYGETDERNIFGEATKEEAEALKDEGIECERIPWVPDHDA